MTLRVAINKFATANKGYQGAKVYVFTVDDDFQKTNTKATLYDGPTGTGTLANPITLDSAGKFDTIPYVEVAVICTVNSMDFGEHDTGVVRIPGGWEGNWSPSTVYQADDLVKDGSAGGNTGNVYICLEPHTSGTSFTNDVDEGKWGLIFDLGTAAGFEAAAEASATAAAASAVTASGAASAASASAIAAAASADSIDDKYLGAKASAPTLDNDGDPLQAGMIYYNTTSGMMFVYDGVGWDATLALPTPLGVAAGGTGATDASGARTSLGVAIGSQVQGYSANLATLAGTTPGAKGLTLLATTTSAGALTEMGVTAAGQNLLDDATADAQLTTLGFSAFTKTLIDDTSPAAARTTLGAVGVGQAIALNLIFGV